MKLKRYTYFLCLLIISSCSYESVNREKNAIAFEENFGFIPPKNISEIKLKNITIRDSFGHWMAFTYTKDSFERILQHDQPLQIAFKGDKDYDQIITKLVSGANIPWWFDIREIYPKKIYYKIDFLDHSYSEYYLLVDYQNQMVYLMVSYFD